MKYGQYGLAPLPNAGAHSPRAHSPLDDVDSDLRRALRARHYTAVVTRSEIAEESVISPRNKEKDFRNISVLSSESKKLCHWKIKKINFDIYEILFLFIFDVVFKYCDFRKIFVKDKFYDI